MQRQWYTDLHTQFTGLAPSELNSMVFSKSGLILISTAVFFCCSSVCPVSMVMEATLSMRGGGKHSLFIAPVLIMLSWSVIVRATMTLFDVSTSGSVLPDKFWEPSDRPNPSLSDFRVRHSIFISTLLDPFGDIKSGIGEIFICPSRPSLTVWWLPNGNGDPYDINTPHPFARDLVIMDVRGYIEATWCAVRFVIIGTLLFFLLLSWQSSMEEGLDSLSPAVGLAPGDTLLVVIPRKLGLVLEGELDTFIFFSAGAFSSPTELRNYRRVIGTTIWNILHRQKRDSDSPPLCLPK